MDELFIKKVEDKILGSKINVSPGDTVKVSVKITEAGKERIQIFEGIVIAITGKGASKAITVRKISHGVGVEKIFPLNSPLIKKIEVTEKGRVRRAKLYYVRDRVGKRALDVRLDETFDASASSALWDSEEKIEDEKDELVAKEENLVEVKEEKVKNEVETKKTEVKKKTEAKSQKKNNKTKAK